MGGYVTLEKSKDSYKLWGCVRVELQALTISQGFFMAPVKLTHLLIHKLMAQLIVC